MKVERLDTTSCCGTSAISLKLGSPITMDCLTLLVGGGFAEIKHYTQSGIMYLENAVLIIIGNFGNDVLSIKCKKKSQCPEMINHVERLLTTL